MYGCNICDSTVVISTWNTPLTDHYITCLPVQSLEPGATLLDTNQCLIIMGNLFVARVKLSVCVFLICFVQVHNFIMPVHWYPRHFRLPGRHINNVS